jgi:multidrug efflux pump subunit AcrB
LPEGMTLRVMFDSTEFIEHSVSEVKFELLLAVALTSLMCWFFLGSVSSTLNVVLAIPMSLMGTIAVLYFLGYTLNTFTLLGLSLAVGIVVDVVDVTPGTLPPRAASSVSLISPT